MGPVSVLLKSQCVQYVCDLSCAWTIRLIQNDPHEKSTKLWFLQLARQITEAQFQFKVFLYCNRLGDRA